VDQIFINIIDASHIRTEKCRNVKYIMCERFEIDGVQFISDYLVVLDGMDSDDSG
jgi:hypothetical protein